MRLIQCGHLTATQMATLNDCCLHNVQSHLNQS